MSHKPPLEGSDFLYREAPSGRLILAQACVCDCGRVTAINGATVSENAISCYPIVAASDVFEAMGLADDTGAMTCDGCSA